ncbi:MAG: hypothetical protein HS115_09660 [Spirochaetales bacterium]|nr:hypothetical protein [Spirochaetales bacterium]
MARLILCLLCVSPLYAQLRTALPDPYYPQLPQGELRLNFYYDRTGRWVKFSDWIPFKQHKYEPRFLEDFYHLYGLKHSYNVPEVKESIYWLTQSLTHRFRHPRHALCSIKNEAEYHKYRNLMFMHINMLIMRMYLRLGSLYDKRQLYFHDLDFADDLEISFLIAATYYKEARPYWRAAQRYAKVASEYTFHLDLPGLESEMHLIQVGKTDYDRIIHLHEERLKQKQLMTRTFLDREGRPRPVKTAIQRDLEKMYDESFKPDPLGPPVLDPEWKEEPLFPDPVK